MGITTYLGDGLYAAFDGYTITLTAPRDNGNHWVELEPEVYRALQEFVADCHKDRGFVSGLEHGRKPGDVP